MTETTLTQEEIMQRAENIDREIHTEMYDNATNIGGVKSIGVREFVNQEAEHYSQYVDEPKPVLRQAATNAAARAVKTMENEGEFIG